IYAQTASTGILGLLPQYVPYGVVAAMASGLALFSYAFKLVIFPAALGQTIIQLVLLPWFVRRKEEAGAAQQYSLALQAAWIFAFSLALPVSMAGYDLAALCFRYGEMTAGDVSRIGHLLSIGIWAAPGMLLAAVWQQMLYAHG